MTEATIWWDLLFGSIGLGYFVYGLKQRSPIPLVCGFLLGIYPFLIDNTLLLVVIGIVLTAIPYFIRL